MIEEECLVKGTPAMLAPIVDGYFLRRWERGEGALRCEIVRERDDTLGLLVRLQDSQRGFVEHGTPGTGAVWLTAQEEPDGLTRLALRGDPADWEAFGLRSWYGLRGELARRRLLVDEPASAPEPAAANTSLAPEDEARLRELWANDDWTVEEIAHEFGWEEDNLRKRVAKKLGLPPRKRGRKSGR